MVACFRGWLLIWWPVLEVGCLYSCLVSEVCCLYGDLFQRLAAYTMVTCFRGGLLIIFFSGLFQRFVAYMVACFRDWLLI